MWKDDNCTVTIRMFCFWASVNVTLLALTAFWSLLSGEQALSASTAIAAPKSLWELFVIVVHSQIGAMPPAAAKRLEERCCVGVPVSLCLQECDMRLLIGCLRSEQR